MSNQASRALRRITRLDFIDGLGVAIGRESVAFARLGKRLATVSLQEHRVVGLPGLEDPAARRLALVEAVRSFLEDNKIQTDRLFVSLPRSVTIVSRLQLPLTVKSDLPQVIDFEIDRLLPLGRDEVYFDSLVRVAGDKIEVLIMSVPRSTAGEILDALEEGGALVRSFVPCPIALQDFLGFTGAVDDEPLAVLLDDAGAAELDLFTGSDLVASHMVRSEEASSAPAIENLVAREFPLAISKDGENKVVGLSLGEAGSGANLPEEMRAGSRELLGRLRDELTVPEGFFENASPGLVPAIGAALAAVREGVAPLNLLPAHERRGVEEGAPVGTFFLAAILVLVSLVWMTSAVVRDQQLLGALEDELALLEPEIRQVHAASDEAQGLREKLEVLVEGENVRNALFLQELTKLVPGDAYLTTFRVRNGRVELEGFASSASDLVPLLEKSRLFKNAKFTSPVTKVQDNQERFSLTTELER